MDEMVSSLEGCEIKLEKRWGVIICIGRRNGGGVVEVSFVYGGWK